MNSFEYTALVYVHFGDGERKKIGVYLRDRYTDVLLVTALGPFRENGLFAEISDCLLSNGIAGKSNHKAYNLNRYQKSVSHRNTSHNILGFYDLVQKGLSTFTLQQ